MKKDLDWFLSRKSNDIVRVYDGKETLVTVVDKETAEIMCNTMQDMGFIFKDVYKVDY